MGRGGQEIETLAGQRASAFKATLYRAGALTNPEHYGVADDSYRHADALRPDDRPGRCDGLFCSVGFTGLSRWFRANRSCRLPADPWEIRYQGSEPYAYPIVVWEAASSLDSEHGYRGYWASGVPLSEALADPRRYRDGAWEVLIDPAGIRSARPVSVRRLITLTDNSYDAEELMHDFYPALSSRGVVYGVERRPSEQRRDDRDGLDYQLMRELRESARRLTKVS